MSDMIVVQVIVQCPWGIFDARNNGVLVTAVSLGGNELQALHLSITEDMRVLEYAQQLHAHMVARRTATRRTRLLFIRGNSTKVLRGNAMLRGVRSIARKRRRRTESSMGVADAFCNMRLVPGMPGQLPSRPLGLPRALALTSTKSSG